MLATPFAAALLSFLFPGLGQASVGNRGRAVIVALPMLAVLGVFAVILILDRSLLFGPTPDQGLLTSLLILDLMLFVYHLWAVLDAYVLAGKAQPDRLQRGAFASKLTIVLSVGVLVSGTIGVHAAVAEVTISWQHALSCNTGATPCWFDISYPQCGSPFPADAEYGIVGVNKGIVFSANPCLGTGDGPPELAWAGGVRAQLYANTGNPGPALSSRWPSDQTSPRQCDASAVAGSDTADCAYDYGWNAAADSYRTAAAAYVSLGLAPAGATSTPSPNIWWLDVETMNSWRPDTSLNVEVLMGAVAYLQSVGTAGIGFYSTQYQWNEITGGTSDFSAYPSWVAGANSAKEAVGICSAKGFTGGRVALVQYPAGDFDGDFLCQGIAGR
jgi:hypothetical protein